MQEAFSWVHLLSPSFGKTSPNVALCTYIFKSVIVTVCYVWPSLTDAVLGQHLMKLSPVHGDYKPETHAEPSGILLRPGRGLGCQEVLKLSGFAYVQ